MASGEYFDRMMSTMMRKYFDELETEEAKKAEVDVQKANEEAVDTVVGIDED